MQVTALGYLGFRTPEFAAWADFGPRVLGLQNGPRGEDGAVYLRMDDRHHRLAFHPGERSELAYIGWELRSRIHFRDALVELEKAGVGFEMGSLDELNDRRVTGMAHFRDPGGFRHEIFFGQEFEHLSFTPGRPISGFLCGELGVGHVVVAVPEATDKHLNFPPDVLGMKVLSTAMLRVLNRSPRMGEFFRCNPRTHCLGIVSMDGLRGMTHFCIETLSIDDVGRALDIIAAENIPLQRTLGRHTLDGFISFYARGPGGITFEYGAGGDLLADDYVSVRPDKSEVWGHKFLITEPPPTLHRIQPK